MKRSGLVMAVMAALLTGCASHPTPAPTSTANSRQVAIMPYATQGVDVAGTTTWYYGRNDGLRAYPAQGGVRYVENVHDLASTDGDDDGHSNSHKQHASQGASASAVTMDSVNAAAKSGDDSAPAGSGTGNASANSLGSQNKAVADGQSAGNADDKPTSFPAIAQEQSPVLSLHFPLGVSDRLYPASQTLLTDWLTAQKGNAVGTLVLVGYTDDIGLDDKNIPLSLSRAKWVETQIKQALPNVGVVTFGSGSRPVATDNRLADGRKINRRVEIYQEAK